MIDSAIAVILSGRDWRAERYQTPRPDQPKDTEEPGDQAGTRRWTASILSPLVGS